MSRFSHNVIGLILVNTARGACAEDTLSFRRSRLLTAARGCAFKMRKTYVDDVAARSARGSSKVSRGACRDALSRGWSLVVDCEADPAVHLEIQASLHGENIDLYDLERLQDEQRLLRMQSVNARVRSQGREIEAKAGRERAKENGSLFGSPRLAKARKASAEACDRALLIRRREYQAWRTEAKAEGVSEPKLFAAWLNARGLRTARGLVWTEVNDRRVLKDLELLEAIGCPDTVSARPNTVAPPVSSETRNANGLGMPAPALSRPTRPMIR